MRAAIAGIIFGLCFVADVAAENMRAPNGDLVTRYEAWNGCYRANGDDRCVETTLIDCNHPLAELVRLYGPVMANACDDINYLKRENARLKRQIKKLRD
jgi:hypothetical protein